MKPRYCIKCGEAVQLVPYVMTLRTDRSYDSSEFASCLNKKCSLYGLVALRSWANKPEKKVKK
jgi:hypothetical protein